MLYLQRRFILQPSSQRSIIFLLFSHDLLISHSCHFSFGFLSCWFGNFSIYFSFSLVIIKLTKHKRNCRKRKILFSFFSFSLLLHRSVLAIFFKKTTSILIMAATIPKTTLGDGNKVPVFGLGTWKVKLLYRFSQVATLNIHVKYWSCGTGCLSWQIKSVIATFNSVQRKLMIFDKLNQCLTCDYMHVIN